MFDELATRLQAMFAPNLSIVRSRREAAQPPFLLSLSWSSGDAYGGGSNNHTIHLELLRPETGLLQVIFQFSFHELSGQCDEWSLIVAGARDVERASLFELFHPRQQTGHWNNHVQPTFEFNGVKTSYENR